MHIFKSIAQNGSISSILSMNSSEKLAIRDRVLEFMHNQRLLHLMIQGYMERINLTDQQVYISKLVNSKLLSSSAKSTAYLIHPKN